MPLCWRRQAPLAGISCFPNVDSAGSDICVNWMYGELATRCCPVGHLALCFKDVYKHDLKLTGIDMGNWEALAADCNN